MQIQQAHKTCAVCGALFKATGASKTCSSACSRKRRLEYARQYAKKPETKEAQKRRWTEKYRHLDRYKMHSTNSSLRSNYGIDASIKSAMLESQGWQCAICKEHLPTLGSACVDHDHSTGEIRKLLCSPCNKGLGHFKDRPELLTAAAHYLNSQRHADFKRQSNP